MTTLSQHSDNFDNNPTKFILKFCLWVFLIGCFFGALSYFAGTLGDAGETVKKEFSVSAMLKKYEWFKEASAQLDKKVADVSVYESRVKNLEDSYKGKNRTEWLRSDAEQYNVWQSEVAGVRASYNLLAAEYNSNMAKFNYSFCNAGDLPRGATSPLPREYKPYITQ